MTKRNFIALADTVRSFLATNAGKGMGDISQGILLRHLADFCQLQNPEFKRERWLGYIAGTNGKNGGKV